MLGLNVEALKIKTRTECNFECRGAPRPPEMCFGQKFSCVDTPKMPEMRLEHRIASANALSGPPNDFLQLGGTQNQNSHDTSVCEGHGVPRPPEVIFGQNFECTTHQNCHKCVWSIILLWQMLCLGRMFTVIECMVIGCMVIGCLR